MKEYKNNQELVDYLISKNVIINDVQSALKNIEKYTYYSIVNGYNINSNLFSFSYMVI